MSGLTWDTDRLATGDDLAALRGELKVEMAELRAELRGEMAELRGEMKAMAGDVVRTLFFGMVATNATLVGLVFAAVRLG
jgi:hypothetical protein